MGWFNKLSVDLFMKPLLHALLFSLLALPYNFYSPFYPCTSHIFVPPSSTSFSVPFSDLRRSTTVFIFFFTSLSQLPFPFSSHPSFYNFSLHSRSSHKIHKDAYYESFFQCISECLIQKYFSDYIIGNTFKKNYILKCVFLNILFGLHNLKYIF